jgi:8-oxo-dGTP pyrophosphatase MutT (NUDIX family)
LREESETVFMANTSEVIPIPSATVILLRDGSAGLETLLLRRNSRIAFHGGAWVFPGGRIDPEDYPMSAEKDDLAAARQAAVREAQEEAGLSINRDALVWISHWTTPMGRPERYATWFFAAVAGSEAVQIDGSEIHDHRWMQPEHALAAQRTQEIELPPPTFVTLMKLSAYRFAADALTDLAQREPEIFIPRFHKVEGGACTLYAEDAGYETGELQHTGRRHRLWMVESGWRYEKTV